MKKPSSIYLNVMATSSARLSSYLLVYTILELWKHIVDNNEMVYLTKILNKFTPKRFYEIDPKGQCCKKFRLYFKNICNKLGCLSLAGLSSLVLMFASKVGA